MQGEYPWHSDGGLVSVGVAAFATTIVTSRPGRADVPPPGDWPTTVPTGRGEARLVMRTPSKDPGRFNSLKGVNSVSGNYSERGRRHGVRRPKPAMRLVSAAVAPFSSVR